MGTKCALFVVSSSASSIAYVTQIAMEYCSAGSVNDLMGAQQATLTEDEIRHICASVCLGMEYLHSSKSIHRVCIKKQT